MRRHGAVPHPAYRLGWGRLSCVACIFGDDDQWHSVRQAVPDQFRKIATYERKFDAPICMQRANRKDPRGIRIDAEGHRVPDSGIFVTDRADAGQSLVPPGTESLLRDATSPDTAWSTRVDPRRWRMPVGAFKKTGGPP